MKYLLIFFFAGTIYAQTDAKIEYQFQNLYSLNKKKEKKSETLQRILNTIENIQFELIYHNNTSVFKVKESLGIGDKSRIFEQLSTMLPKTFITYNDMKLYDFSEISGQKFFVEEVVKGKWNITNEQEIIMGYVCTKALLKNENNDQVIAEAWFTKEIALPIGPSYYFGLPGLVLKVIKFNPKTGKKLESFEINDIDLSPQKPIKLPNQKTITREEFNEFMNASRSRF